VTDDLDEGPIIDQAVERVDHTFGPAELIEHRILLNKHKTVVFR
jgi:formyltetrahydrofolate deformylase